MRNVFESDENDIQQMYQPSPFSLITATNDDATTCRYSAHRAGLIHDPLVHHFLPANHPMHMAMKDPLINRGTYLRVSSVDKVLATMLEEGPLQVISLGAGFDTRFFNFKDNKNLKYYVEIDFEEVIQRKQHVISHHGLDSPKFVIADLEIDFKEKTLPKIIDIIDRSCRTLIISECCLMYLTDSAVLEILKGLCESLDKAELVIFDPLFVGDRFGKMMSKNLFERGLPTETFEKYANKDDYINRVNGCGWEVMKFQTMADLCKETDHTAVLRKAPLDEYEEWSMITMHYFILQLRNYN